MSKMREKKFRAWDKDIPGWVENISDSDALRLEKAFPKSVVAVQFTGSLDMSGEEIFEGDRWQRGLYIGFVEFVCAGWQFTRAEDSMAYSYPSFYSQARLGKIIGNIYENPELLK